MLGGSAIAAGFLGLVGTMLAAESTGGLADPRRRHQAAGAALRSASNDGDIESDERETIVFRRAAGGAWLAFHEHLSPTP